MRPATVFTELLRRGVDVRSDGESLRLRARRGVLTNDLRRAVSANKGGLLELMRIREEILSSPGADVVGPVANLPGDVLECIASIKVRFGGEVVGLALDEHSASVCIEDAADQPADSCFACRSSHLWRSVHGPVVCGDCHPPAADSLVAEWLTTSDPETGDNHD